jgi:pimeloyl-ACP methyl ester carboxylesterase
MTQNILNHPLISARYFFPRPGAIPNPYMVDVGNAQLACWRNAPPSDRSVLVYFHGNGELVGDWVSLFSQLSTINQVDVFLAEYRGYGMSTGTPALLSMLDDLDAIADAVGVPKEQIIVFGRSVGSIFAIEWIKRFPQTAGLIIESGIHDVYQRLRLRVHPEEIGCSEAEFRTLTNQYFNHDQKLSAYLNPSLFIHAQHDQIVTIEHAHQNARSAKNGMLKILNNGGHNDILFANMEEYLLVLNQFLSRCSL